MKKAILQISFLIAFLFGLNFLAEAFPPMPSSITIDTVTSTITSILGDPFDSEAELTALTSTTVTDSVADTETIALTSGYKEYDIYLTQTTDATGAIYLPEQAGMLTDAIAYIYNAGTFAATFPFSAGVQEFNGGEAGDYLEIQAGGHLIYRYTGTRWVCISNEGSKQYFSTFETVETDFIPITYMNDGTSAPAEAALVTSTNSALCRAFDGAANEDGKIVWKVPPDIDATVGIKFQVVGKVGSATAPAEGEVIAFSLAGMSVGNSDILSGAVGTPQTSSLTAAAGYVQYDEVTTTFSPAITVTNLAAGETAHLDLIRLATSTDTYAQDFHPYGINIKYMRLHNATF